MAGKMAHHPGFSIHPTLTRPGCPPKQDHDHKHAVMGCRTLAEASAAEASEATAETAKRDSRAGARGWEAAEEAAAREREGFEKRGGRQEALRGVFCERGDVLVTDPERDAVEAAWMLIAAAIVKGGSKGVDTRVFRVEGRSWRRRLENLLPSE